MISRRRAIYTDPITLVPRPAAPGLVAAFLLACPPSMIATSRAIYTDPIMLVLALAALDRMQAYRAGDGVAALLFVSALVGLAIGAKYPAVVLLLPLAWTLARSHAARGGWRGGPPAPPAPAV